MSFAWFFVACALLVLWLSARHTLRKELQATERRRKEAFVIWEERKEAQEKAARLAEELLQTQTRIDGLREKIGTLTFEASKIQTERDQLQARFARIEGLGALEDAITYAARLHDSAEEQMYDAKKEVARLIGDAEEQARQIAGAAYDIAQREGELKRTVRALENTINGYGDAYLIPTSSLMDELEERYGFADAGKKLKEARQTVVSMIKRGTAASCDYVEKNRKDTAIAFVLDAFNGKAATALSAVKNDNYGKLAQQLKDAFQLVNFHGEAFRSARIEPAYFEAQLNVLRWAVAVQELRRQEQEEQRALREEMREEEKAIKEYERALSQAARDERIARKAVDDVRQALLAAGDAERQKLEAQLAALTEKLLIAEEQGKRAMSMAQQTRKGTVYVISNVGSFGDEVFKIGMTRRLEPLDRVKELGDASVPFSFDVHALIRTDDAPALEKELHKVFVRNQVNKVNARKEFFRTQLSHIRSSVEQMGIEASWTMAAACTEWRETAVIEKELAAEGVAAKRWEEKQMRVEAMSAE